MLTDTEAFWQSYSEFIPTEGQIVVMFGNWYSDLLVTATHVSEPLDDSRFDEYVENMRAFEQDLKITMSMWLKSGSIYHGNRCKTFR